ncbi:MAG: acetyl-CoA carboxylase, carboxyltransferase subunit beta [Holosporales bacterium]|nr:acetyl-CoA carboxylase, carboxyltransferase subunit beta [Holosporales bacterium]
MSWLTDFVKPRIQRFVKREAPENLWQKCSACEQMLFNRDLQENLYVCKHCGHHLKFPPKERVSHLFDGGDYTRLSWGSVLSDPLHFRDSKKYADRLKEAKSKTGEEDAIILARGTLGGRLIIVACFNFDFIGGSMGMAVGEALVRGAEAALEDRAPFIVIPASGGARMQEGIFSLMQMPRSVIAISRLKENGVPYVTVLTNPTTGGVSASFAALGDLAIGEPGAIIGFTGARVIQEILRTSLPPGFQSAEFQMDHGMIDMVVHRHDLRDKLNLLCTLLMGPKRLAAQKEVRTLPFKK